MASALSSWENCSSRCDDVRRIAGDRDDAEDAAPPGGSPACLGGATAEGDAPDDTDAAAAVPTEARERA